MKITQVAVIKAARVWSAKKGQNEEQAAADAADAIGKIRFRFTGDQYQLELEKLYERYAES